MVHLVIWEFIKPNEHMFVTEVSELISKILLYIIVYFKCMQAVYFEKQRGKDILAERGRRVKNRIFSYIIC